MNPILEIPSVVFRWGKQGVLGVLKRDSDRGKQLGVINVFKDFLIRISVDIINVFGCNNLRFLWVSQVCIFCFGKIFQI